MSDLAEVFAEEPGESPEQKVETPEPQEQAKEPDSEPTSDSKSEEESKDEPKPKEESEEKSDEPEGSAKEKAYLAQAKDERQKRQKRDERIRELEEKLTKLESPEDNKRPDVFEDQEAYTESLRSEIQQEVSKAKLDVARDMMISFHDDYEEVESFVLEEVQDNPALKAELQNSKNVAKAVYDYGKKIRQFREMKEFKADEYKAKLRAEIKAELQSELKKEQDSNKDDEGENLSPSLANARGGGSVPDEKEVTDIGDLF